jgi:hypothetical protein
MLHTKTANFTDIIVNVMCFIMNEHKVVSPYCKKKNTEEIREGVWGENG